MIVGIDGVGIMCMEKDSERLGIHASHITKLYELKEREGGREGRRREGGRLGKEGEREGGYIGGYI